MIDQLMHKLGYVRAISVARRLRITWVDKDGTPLVMYSPSANLAPGDSVKFPVFPDLKASVADGARVEVLPALLDHMNVAAFTMRQKITHISITLEVAKG